MSTCEIANGVHVGHLSEEVNGHDGFCFWSDAAGGVGEIEVEGVGVVINEDGGGADARDAAGGGEEGEGGAEDFVAGADVEGHEGEQDGVGAGGDADGVFGVGEGGGGLFEVGDFAAEDELAGFEDAGEGCFEFGGEGGVLLFEIEKGDQFLVSH